MQMLNIDYMKRVICRRVFVSVIVFPLLLLVRLYAQPIDDSLVSWSKYTGKSAFTIMVPSTVELRKPEDAYSQNSICYNDDAIVFQQKGLSRFGGSAFKKYCRIMINYVKGEYGDFLKSTESEMIDIELKNILEQIVVSNIGTASQLMGQISYCWITVGGAKCLQIDYRRTGSNFDITIPVICRMAIFQNDNEMVIMTLAYREKEADFWKTDFDKVFKSFRWI